MMPNEIHILLIEDNPGDVELVRAGLAETSLNIQLNVLYDGQEASQFFERQQQRPDLVLLDINLPKVNGLKVLQQIRANSWSANIPVIVLSSSNTPADIKSSYAQHANSFVTKPADFESFMQVIKSIEKFWLNLVKLPTYSLPKVSP